MKRVLVGLISGLALLASAQDANQRLKTSATPAIQGPQAIPDAELAADVRRAIGVDSSIQLWAIGVEARSGWIHLFGSVTNSYQKMHAGSIAASVDGVTRVVNDIQYRYEWKPMDDKSLQNEVNLELYFNPYVDSQRVHVSAEDGVVTLFGKVGTWGERQEAEDSAYQAGAKGVNNDLEITYDTNGPFGFPSFKAYR